MAQTKTTYLSTDGKEFKTELEADARDMYLKLQGGVEAYIVAAGLDKAPAGMLRKHIPGYISFCKTGGVSVDGTPPEAEPGDDA